MLGKIVATIVLVVFGFAFKCSNKEQSKQASNRKKIPN
jgi:hypothetical protein